MSWFIEKIEEYDSSFKERDQFFLLKFGAEGDASPAANGEGEMTDVNGAKNGEELKEKEGENGTKTQDIATANSQEKDGKIYDYTLQILDIGVHGGKKTIEFLK